MDGETKKGFGIMKTFVSAAAFTAALFSAAGFAQAATLADMVGTWSGGLTAPSGAQAPLIVHVMADGTGTVDSPAQDVFGVPAEGFQLEHNIFTFTVPRIDVRFHGMLEGDLEAVDGQWSQNGKSLPLRLIRRDVVPQP